MGSKTKSKQKLEMTPQQKKAWEFYGTDIVPMARGEDTAIGRQLEQQGSDIAALQRSQSGQQIMDVAGTAGMGSSQIAGLLSESEDNAVQAAFKNIMGAKLSMANKALDMISGLPKAPTALTETKETTMEQVKGYSAGFKNLTGAAVDIAKIASGKVAGDTGKPITCNRTNFSTYCFYGTPLTTTIYFTNICCN